MLLDLLVLIARLHTATYFYACGCYKKDGGFKFSWCRIGEWADMLKYLQYYYNTIGNRYWVRINMLRLLEPTQEQINVMTTYLSEAGIKFQIDVTPNYVAWINDLECGKDYHIIYFARKNGWDVFKQEKHSYLNSFVLGGKDKLAPYC